MPIARSAPAGRTTLALYRPPRVERDGRALHVGTRKAMAVLALLALDGALTRERLATLLWPDVDASAARRNLRRELFRLREGEAPLVETGDVALTLAPGESVDVQHFRDALAAGDDAGALRAGGRSVFDGLDGAAGPKVAAWLSRARTQLRSWPPGPGSARRSGRAIVRGRPGPARPRAFER